MTLVLDCSVALAWYIDDQSTPTVDQVAERVADEGAIVPSLWRLEVANGLQTAMRQRRITTARRHAILTNLSALPISIDPETDDHAWAGTVKLADRFRLTTYDAAYLELAERRGLPLASLDRALRAAARTLGLAVLGI
ncbi:MAG TPA: type II toxin-antitoxin system VapC family toxin [Stellaceae bacterium]|nr:type II toxin-antitoxin system VapC family toxin [Stellaceae bacterium]